MNREKTKKLNTGHFVLVIILLFGLSLSGVGSSLVQYYLLQQDIVQSNRPADSPEFVAVNHISDEGDKKMSTDGQKNSSGQAAIVSVWNNQKDNNSQKLKKFKKILFRNSLYNNLPPKNLPLKIPHLWLLLI